MNIKKILTIVIAILVLIGVIFGIIKIVDIFRKDYKSPLAIEYNYYKIYSNGKFGVVNTKGENIIPASYDDVIIPNPSKDLFICIYNYNTITEEYDYIILNEKAEEILTKYDKVQPISVTGIIGTIPYEKWALKYKKENLYGLVSIDGKKITNAIYEEIESVPYKEGVFLVKKDGRYGVINNKGVTLIKNEYENIIGDGYFNNEIGYKASGFIVTKQTEQGEYLGYINSTGEVILDNEFDSIYRIKELEQPYIIAKKNGQYGLLNNTRILIGFNYQELNYDENANLIIVKRSKNYGIINMEGNKVLPLEYSNISIEGIYIIGTKNEAIEKFTLAGQPVTNDIYMRIDKTNSDYYISIDKNYNYGILDKNMNVILENKYDYLEYIFNNLVIARNSSGKYGIINLQEQNLLSFDYDVVQVIKDTQIIQGIILDTNTVHLYNSNMERILNEKNANIFTYDNYIKIVIDNSVKYFNKNGEEVDKSVVYPENNILSYEENGKWGFKDKNGKVIIEAKYDKVTELNENGFAGIKLGDKWGVINQKGTIILEPTYNINDTNGEPDFLGFYYRIYSGYADSYYTNV